MTESWREFGARQVPESFRGPRKTAEASKQIHVPEPLPIELRERLDGPVQRDGGRVRHASGVMNGLEKKFGAHLDIRIALKEIRSWKFEPLKLRLAHSTFYNVDFMVNPLEGRIEMWETKGHWEDDARVKVKVAANMFPEFKFFGAQWDKARKDWKVEEFKG